MLHISLPQIPKAAEQIAKQLWGGEIFGLVGTLGSGKTTFVKALGKQLKVKNKITSPTFILLQGFEAKLPLRGGSALGRKSKKKVILYHLDLYRIKNFTEARALGLTEFWGKPETVTLIEWADRIKKHLPKKTQIIEFSNK